jgi:hypothetical protein
MLQIFLTTLLQATPVPADSIDLDGAGLERVTTHADFDAFPMFSPDGRRLVWASNRHLFIADWVERP